MLTKPRSSRPPLLELRPIAAAAPPEAEPRRRHAGCSDGAKTKRLSIDRQSGRRPGARRSASPRALPGLAPRDCETFHMRPSPCLFRRLPRFPREQPC
eukprot:scaffold4852_cov148-Isochrysis_galbana.AAC.3